MAEALPDLCLQPVVPAAEAVIEQDGGRSQNPGEEQGPVIHVLQGRRRAGYGIRNIAGRIEIPVSFELYARLADIRSLYHCGGRDLPLDGQIP